MNGGDDNSGSGIFCEHGNHTQTNTGSQTLISILSLVGYIEISV